MPGHASGQLRVSARFGVLLARLSGIDLAPTTRRSLGTTRGIGYRGRLENEPPTEFAGSPKLLFEPVSDPATRAGTRRFEGAAVAGETDEDCDADNSRRKVTADEPIG